MGSASSVLLPPGTVLVNTATGQPLAVAPGTTLPATTASALPTPSTGETTASALPPNKKNNSWWIILVVVLVIVVVVVGLILAIIFTQPQVHFNSKPAISEVPPYASSGPIPLNSLTSIDPLANYPRTSGQQYTIQSVDDQMGIQAELNQGSKTSGYTKKERYSPFGPEQRWSFTKVLDTNLYAINNPDLSLAWQYGTTEISGKDPSMQLAGYNWNGEPNQRFELVLIGGNANDPIGGGVFAINSRQSTLGDCCSMQSDPDEDYTVWGAWNWLGNPVQQWLIKLHNF